MNWVQDTLVMNYWGLWEPRERSLIHFLSSVLFNQRALQATPRCPGYPMLCVTNHPQLCTLKYWYILFSHGSLIWLGLAGWFLLGSFMLFACQNLAGIGLIWRLYPADVQAGTHSMMVVSGESSQREDPNMGCGDFLQHGGCVLREIIPRSTQETPVDAT